MKRRQLLSGTATLSGALLLSDQAGAATATPQKKHQPLKGKAHWTVKHVANTDVRLFMWQKQAVLGTGQKTAKGTIVFVHGSSVSSTPVFDLQIPGRPESSMMDWFAQLGYDTWCFDWAPI